MEGGSYCWSQLLNSVFIYIYIITWSGSLMNTDQVINLFKDRLRTECHSQPTSMLVTRSDKNMYIDQVLDLVWKIEPDQVIKIMCHSVTVMIWYDYKMGTWSSININIDWVLNLPLKST